LEELFNVVGLVEQKGGEDGCGFGLPPEVRKEERSLVLASLRCLNSVLLKCDTAAYGAVEYIDKDTTTTKAARGPTMPSQEELAKAKVMRGPTMPSQEELAKAKAMRGPTMPSQRDLAVLASSRPSFQHEEEEDEAYDGAGPKLGGNEMDDDANSNEVGDVDLAARRQEKEAEWAMVRSGMSAAEAAKATARAKAQVRQEEETHKKN
jgi:hypothetical protein